MSEVLVLNADLDPLHRVTFQHALRMLWRGVAEVHEADVGRPPLGDWSWPKVVRLVRYVVARWRYESGPVWSRPGVLRRDDRTCGYCAGPAATVDHVQPRARGGRNTWDNTVASCDPCNQRKGDRTPAEAGMRLLVRPRRPRWAEVITR